MTVNKEHQIAISAIKNWFVKYKRNMGPCGNLPRKYTTHIHTKMYLS